MLGVMMSSPMAQNGGDLVWSLPFLARLRKEAYVKRS